MNFAPEFQQSEFEFKTLLTPLDTTAAAQKIPLQGRKDEFEPDKAQYSTPNFFVVSYKSISKPKIYARPRPSVPCQPWRPCLCRRRKEDQEIEKKERNKIAFLFRSYSVKYIRIALQCTQSSCAAATATPLTATYLSQLAQSFFEIVCTFKKVLLTFTQDVSREVGKWAFSICLYQYAAIYNVLNSNE